MHIVFRNVGSVNSEQNWNWFLDTVFFLYLYSSFAFYLANLLFRLVVQ